MVLLNEDEINLIIKKLNMTKCVKWHLEDLKGLFGYQGDHLKLIIEGEKDGAKEEVQLFVKCMPRYDEWKAEFLQEARLFAKEYVMLHDLFEKFHIEDGSKRWRPTTFYVRQDLFVFEDVSKLGYEMPHFQDTMSFDALKATVKTVARFHAQSFIYEEKRTKELGKPYRIWDEYSEYLQEPNLSTIWRKVGSDAIIEFMKAFSKYKSNADFNDKVEKLITNLYEKTMDLVKPDINYRNVVVHKDLWSNNIFIKNDGTSEPHAMIVDFQTVIYCPPMFDVSSLVYLNTLKSNRDAYTTELLKIYYNELSEILKEFDINIDAIVPKDKILEDYDDSLIFAMTQAALVVPFTSMSKEWKEKLFSDPVTSERINLVSRSKEYIDIANDDPVYKNRVTELLDEIVAKYIYNEAAG